MDPQPNISHEPACPPGLTDAAAAGAGSQQTSAQAARLTREAATTVTDVTQQAGRKAAEYTERARRRGQEALDQQKHRTAEQLHTVGEAVHRAAGKFREEHDDNLAGYVDAMADEVDRFADYLDRRDLGSLVRDTQNFARREPEWFLGGMFLAGLALTRFLKASGRGDGQGEWARSGRSGSSASDEPWAPERSASPPASPAPYSQGTVESSSEVHHHGPQ